jgi:hypothetical protein
MENQPPYELLNLPLDASQATIKKQYKLLIRQFPPEKYPDEFNNIRAAYEALTTNFFDKPKLFFPYKRAIESQATQYDPSVNVLQILTTAFETPFDTSLELEKLLENLDITS